MSSSTVGTDTAMHALYRAALDQAFDPMVQMDVHGRIVEWNLQAERCFGWRRQEVVGGALHERIFPVEHHPQYL